MVDGIAPNDAVDRLSRFKEVRVWRRVYMCVHICFTIYSNFVIANKRESGFRRGGEVSVLSLTATYVYSVHIYIHMYLIEMCLNIYRNLR